MSQDAGLDIDFDNPVPWDQELARIQAESAEELDLPAPAEVPVAEGKVVTSSRTVELAGERFRISQAIGLMPLLKFSAHSDMQTSDPGALAAMYAMLRDCIEQGSPPCGKCAACKDGDETSCKDWDPGDWARFERHAIDVKADADELLTVISQAIELISGRPTAQPPSSSPGQRSTRGGSTARSSARARRGSRR